jgi:molybdopterin/thiamine biosynthesis adenylyltransferase
MKIGIAGAGGIGSNVAVHLVRSGVESIKIADFDRIEKSNLNRQFYFYDQIGMYKSEAVEARQAVNNLLTGSSDGLLDMFKNFNLSMPIMEINEDIQVKEVV